MNDQRRRWIHTKDKPGLLIAMMRELSGASNISFEGALDSLKLEDIEGASINETDSLRRQTRSPELDFVVVPLTDSTIDKIWKEVTENDHLVHEGIVHVQIECDGVLAFGGYDNFHRECVVAYDSVPNRLLEELKEVGVIRGFSLANK